MRAVVGGASLTAQVGDAIREAILAGELRPGELYSVSRLAASLDVSRTPVREALLGLADAGIVRVERNRGFRVVRQDGRHLSDVFELRLLLEVPAAGTAAALADTSLHENLQTSLAAMRAAAGTGDEAAFMRHDRAFHDAVLRAGGNRLLPGVVAGLRDTISTLGASTVARSRSLGDIAAEHEAVLEAIRTNDPVRAAAAMQAHLEHTRDLLLAQVADGS